MPSSEQRIHAWILLGIVTLLMGGAVFGVLWGVLASTGDGVGAAVARIGAIASGALLAMVVVGQAAWISCTRIRSKSNDLST